MKKLLLILLCLPISVLGQKSLPTYICPPCNGACDTIVFHHPGICPDCGMILLNKDSLNQPKTTVCFYLYEGVEILDFAGPMEVFANAGFKVFTVSKKKAPFLSQGILTITPDYSIADAPPADIFAVFGGDENVPANDPEVISWIRSRDQSTGTYFSVCTGAFILGRAGLLDNQTVTTYHNRIAALQREVPKAKVLENVRYVDNGRVITTAGISAGIDGALHLVAKLKGAETAMLVAKHMEYDKYVPAQGLVVKHGPQVTNK